MHRCVGAPQIQPILAAANQDCVFAQLHRRLALAVEPVRRGVAAQQGSERYPQFAPNLLQRTSARGNQRSISPNTISIDPMTATTSASMRPWHIVSSACNVA